MGIPVGKAVVYGGSGVDPRRILPVTVDVGCNTKAVTDDPFYCGTRCVHASGVRHAVS